MLHKCKMHGMTEHSKRKDGYWRCRACAIEAVARRRKKIKLLLIEEGGGKCKKCGYNKCPAALEFHHRDPTEKETVNLKSCLSMKTLLKEIAKCDLLCANCHREEHFSWDGYHSRIA